MPNIYCPSCGMGIKYLYQKPSNCTSCNYLFTSVALDFTPKKKSSKIKPSSIIEEDEDLDEDDEEDYSRPSLSMSARKKFKKIKPNIAAEPASFEKFGEVIGSDPGAKREKRKAVSKEEIRSRVFSSKGQDIENV